MFELIHVIQAHRTTRNLTKSSYNCLNITGLSGFFNSMLKEKNVSFKTVNTEW
jgi:hypothetical protein